ncbi:MAG: OmpW family outer membrane protein [Geminicoccaceae bacterium]
MKSLKVAALLCGLLALQSVPAGADDYTFDGWHDWSFPGKSAGDFMVRVRGIYVRPDNHAKIDPIGGNTNLSNETVPEIDFSYFIFDQLAVELIAATTSHSVKVRGTSIGNAKVGNVKLLPPTLTLQWHPLPKARISPYIGTGFNWTLFYDAEARGIADSFTVDNSEFGWALQAGTDIAISGNWYLNFDVKKIFLSTNAEINNSIKADVDVNPWIFGVGVGYLF